MSPLPFLPGVERYRRVFKDPVAGALLLSSPRVSCLPVLDNSSPCFLFFRSRECPRLRSFPTRLAFFFFVFRHDHFKLVFLLSSMRMCRPAFLRFRRGKHGQRSLSFFFLVLPNASHAVGSSPPFLLHSSTLIPPFFPALE